MAQQTLHMTEAEREHFLSEVHVGVLAIERRDRAPLTVPIWYGYQPGGLITVLMSPDSLKARLLARCGRFSLCVQTEKPPYRYVSVEGPIVDTRQCDVEADARVMARRYLGKELGDQYVEDGDDASMICVSMRPETWYTVDYGKAV